MKHRDTLPAARRPSSIVTLAAVLAAALVSMTGCSAVQFRQPLFPGDAREVAFDPALLGKWQHLEDGKRAIYEVARLNELGYVILYEDDGRPQTATMRLLKTRGVSLLEVCYRNSQSDDTNRTLHYFTYHVYARVRIEPDALHVAALGGDWLEDRIRAARRLTRSEGAGEFIVTAPAAALRKDLLHYLDRPEAFRPEEELTRVK